MTYFVSYIDTEDDLCHVNVEADNENSAKLQVLKDYWNVNEIIEVSEYEID